MTKQTNKKKHKHNNQTKKVTKTQICFVKICVLHSSLSFSSLDVVFSLVVNGDISIKTREMSTRHRAFNSASVFSIRDSSKVPKNIFRFLFLKKKNKKTKNKKKQKKTKKTKQKNYLRFVVNEFFFFSSLGFDNFE